MGFTIQQFPVGKTHSGVHNGKLLGFKTIITPSKEAVQRHRQELRRILREYQSAPQKELIDQLNPVIRGWAMYYQTVVSQKSFETCDHLLFGMLWQKMTRRHPNKNAKGVKEKYGRAVKGTNWTVAVPSDSKLRTVTQHAAIPIKRQVKVKGTASPFDGKLLYGAKRVKDHPLTRTKLGRLLHSQQGKCRWCEMLFQAGDHIEIDHITPRSQGGKDTMDNLVALHTHCHHQRHTKLQNEASITNDRMTEEPCDAKVSSTVL